MDGYSDSHVVRKVGSKGLYWGVHTPPSPPHIPLRGDKNGTTNGTADQKRVIETLDLRKRPRIEIPLAPPKGA